jgi:ATP-binding cassette subfamily B protein
MNSVSIEKVNALSYGMAKRLFAYLKPYRKYYATVCIAGLVVAVLEMIPPRLVGLAINAMTVRQCTMGLILLIAGTWVVSFVISQFLHSIQIKLANRYGERVLATIRQEIFNHLQKLSMGYFDRTHLGRIISQASNDIDAMRSVLIWGMNTIVANSAVMIFASVMIFITDRELFFAVAWLAPAITILSFIYGKRVGEAWQEVRVHSARVSANQAENIAGVRVVTAFNRQAHNLERYGELQEINTRNNVRAAGMGGKFQALLQWARFLGQGIVLIYGGYRVSQGTLKPGDLVAVSLYWEWFMSPAVTFGSFFNELLIALSSAERVFSILDERPEIQDQPGSKPLPMLQGSVKLEDVSFGYRPETPVLRNVSIDVPAGSTVALVGATGSGKSTIISLLARFYKPTRGSVKIDDHDIHEATGESLHRQMALVSQNNFLFSGTVLENLKYVKPDSTEREIIDAAKKLGCHERFLGLKSGYATQVGERGANLSLGERQLLCFTRALLTSPRILLLDEATSAVDPMTELQIQDALQRLVKNRTTFIVAHRLSTIVNADLILVLDQGRIVEKGTHHELIRLGGRYAQLHGSSGLANVHKISQNQSMGA